LRSRNAVPLVEALVRRVPAVVSVRLVELRIVAYKIEELLQLALIGEARWAYAILRVLLRTNEELVKEATSNEMAPDV